MTSTRTSTVTQASSTTITSTTFTQSTFLAGTYHVRVNYSAVDQTICPSFIYACSWSGSIAADTGVAYLLGPTTGTASYPFYLDTCGEELSWSLSVSTGSYLTVTVLDQNGYAVYVETTLMKLGETLDGSYFTCASASITTTTVTFPVTITTVTFTNTTTYPAPTPVDIIVDYVITNQTECGSGKCDYWIWDLEVNDPSTNRCVALCVTNFPTDANETYQASFTCSYRLLWSFQMEYPTNVFIPNASHLVFAIKSSDGSVLYTQSTVGNLTSIAGTWQPPCAYGTATTTMTKTIADHQQSNLPPFEGTLGAGLILATVSLIVLRKQRGASGSGRESSG